MITATLVAMTEGADTRRHLFLAEAPFPGDTILTHAGQELMVVRRQFIDHGAIDAVRGIPGTLVDVKLWVRPVESVVS